MRRAIKHLFVLASACLLFLANPAFFGCSEDDEHFEFGESEMRTFIEGTWSGSLTLDGVATPFTLELQQAANPTVASGLCDQRSFVAPASACIAMSSMPVLGTLTTDDGRFTDAPVSGSLEVYGADFNNAMLYFSLAGGTSFNISSSSGQAFDQDGQISGSSAAGTFSLMRPVR